MESLPFIWEGRGVMSYPNVFGVQHFFQNTDVMLILAYKQKQRPTAVPIKFVDLFLTKNIWYD